MSELLIYTANEKNVTVRLEGETVWLSQKQLADLLETSTDNIGLHLKNIYAQEELDESATTEDFSVVQTEGARQVTRKVMHYNLDAIISVGYRVNSRRGVQFRQWATRILREHLVQGYSLNPVRLARRRQPTCCTSSSRTTRFPTATSASAPSCSCSICNRKAWP